ncbi:hypothetical protein WH47_10702 [Habropoda laboriosa]|uniref:Uncharacterized protein n=1 Tax=Habropoda laboriosa TaxID=597456 RepID=A0A0L7RBX3_9HYME|nr:PREDICTED: uncharacterized protein LOC108579741 [Habropoda laboriosa]KOC68462.1 hypothetical protein WH47_10702 [Habropoda laboriosa]
MSCDLLPEWLNLFLDDVETTLCLPILLIMVHCTVQFIINHAMDIGLTFYQTVIQKSDEEEAEEVECDNAKCGQDLLSKIKGFFYNLSLGFNTDSKPEERAPPSLVRPALQEEDWDYCEEDDEENL